MRKALALLVALSLLLALLPLSPASPEAVSIGAFKVPGTIHVTVVAEPPGGQGKNATLFFTPYAPGNVTIVRVEATNVSDGSLVTPSKVYVNGTEVSPPAKVYMRAKTNITAVFQYDVKDVNFMLDQKAFLDAESGELSFSYPAKTGTLKLKLPVSYGAASPAEIRSIDTQVELKFNNTVKSVQLTSLSGGQLGSIAASGSTVIIDVRGSPSFTAGLELELEAASLTEYEIKVAGYTAPSGTTVFLSPDIAVAAKNATLATWFNGTAAKPGATGTYHLEAAGAQKVKVKYDTLEDYTYKFVRLDAGNIKYYQLKLKPLKSNECWVALTSGFGNYTFALSVNGTQVKPYGQDKLYTHYVKPFVASGWISLPGVSLTYEVNDSAKTVDVAWDNSAYKTAFPQVYKLTVTVKSRKPVEYKVDKTAYTPVLYSESQPSTAESSGKHIKLELSGLYVLFTGDDVLKAENAYKTMKVEGKVVHGVDYSGSVDLVARVIALVHNANGTVQGAKVSLYDASTGALLETRYTDADGLASINAAPVKNYLLEVDSAGEIHTTSVYMTDSDSFNEFAVTAVPAPPVITLEVALLIVVVLAAAMLLLFAYYVVTSRRSIVIE